uniref:Eukaryotic translation initiation factor 3 subunit G N-terminal domain-containing protein n=1 Tax=Noccaea caerulescens TaxID=107243 RepID=A0A1J3G6R4_NOCCA
MFGDAAKKDADSCLTMRSTEDVILERIRAPGFKAEEAKPSGDTMSGAVLMVCRLCLVKGDHWTARCPQRDLLSLKDEPLTAETCTAGTGTSKAEELVLAQT